MKQISHYQGQQPNAVWTSTHDQPQHITQFQSQVSNAELVGAHVQAQPITQHQGQDPNAMRARAHDQRRQITRCQGQDPIEMRFGAHDQVQQISHEAISIVGQLMRPLSEEELGVDPLSRFSTLMAVPCSGDEDQYLPPDSENEDTTNFLALMRRAKVQLIGNAGPSNAMLTLLPKSGEPEFSLSVQADVFVIFSAERFRFMATSMDQQLSSPPCLAGYTSVGPTGYSSGAAPGYTWGPTVVFKGSQLSSSSCLAGNSGVGPPGYTRGTAPGNSRSLTAAVLVPQVFAKRMFQALRAIPGKHRSGQPLTNPPKQVRWKPRGDLSVRYPRCPVAPLEVSEDYRGPGAGSRAGALLGGSQA